MYETPVCPVPEGRCADLAYRLAVYEAGHALTARALGFRVLSVTMLPRPPILESDKVLEGSSQRALIPLLENRCIELFGGQIAEEHACKTSSCCSGDVARIDELTRLVSGLDGKRTPEEIWFELEDVALDIFSSEKVRAAVVPIAELLFSEVGQGNNVIPGARVEALMDELLGRPEKARGGLLSRLMSRA
jgi:hypothetical protein